MDQLFEDLYQMRLKELKKALKEKIERIKHFKAIHLKEEQLKKISQEEEFIEMILVFIEASDRRLSELKKENKQALEGNRRANKVREFIIDQMQFYQNYYYDNKERLLCGRLAEHIERRTGNQHKGNI